MRRASDIIQAMLVELSAKGFANLAPQEFVWSWWEKLPQLEKNIVGSFLLSEKAQVVELVKQLSTKREKDAILYLLTSFYRSIVSNPIVGKEIGKLLPAFDKVKDIGPPQFVFGLIDKDYPGIFEQVLEPGSMGMYVTIINKISDPSVEKVYDIIRKYATTEITQGLTENIKMAQEPKTQQKVFGWFEVWQRIWRRFKT